MAMTHADFARHCAYLSRYISGWGGDFLTLPEQHLEAVKPQDVARFTDELRGRLDHIDNFAGRTDLPQSGDHDA